MTASSLRQQIQSDIKEAMIKRDSQTLETLRYIWSEMKNLEIDLKNELEDKELSLLIKREVKKRKDAIEQFIKGGRQELADQEQTKVALIIKYLPEQMSEIEISEVIDSCMTDPIQDFGSLMKAVMVKLKDKADGATVSRLVKQKLS